MVGLDPEEYQKMYQLEEKYWWFVGKRFLLASFLKKIPLNKNPRLLDVGCGTGLTAEMLKKYGSVWALDSSKEALDFCKKRSLANLQLGSVEKLPYSDNFFDVVTCLDVLYHQRVKDDSIALKEINRVLLPGGYLLLTDAALPCLWSRHDLVHHSRRRYTCQELAYKLKRSGFEIKKLTYFNTALFPLVFLSRKINNFLNLKPSSDIKKTNKVLNFLLKKLYLSELSLLPYFNYPFGVSVFALARKR